MSGFLSGRTSLTSVATADLEDDAVTTAKIADVNVSTGKVADDAITLAKMAPGTDGNLITYDASGNPAVVATGSSGQVLTSAGAGAPPTMTTLANSGSVFISRSTASDDASVGINGLTSYDNYTFVINYVPVTDNVVLRLRVDTDNGASYDAGSNYNWSEVNLSEAASQTLRGGASSDHIELGDGIGSAATEGISVVLQMSGRNIEAISQYFTFIRVFTHESGVLRGGSGTGMWDRSISGDTSNDIDAVQFSFSSGNIESGTVDVFGWKNS